MIVGGAACPPALMKAFATQYGVELQHAWGMTELSPLGTVNTLKAQHLSLDADAQATLAEKQGRPPFGIDLKTVDDVGRELTREAAKTGDLLIRGQWGNTEERRVGQERGMKGRR